ncbi:hypothetical protein EG68_08469 [Paragonimus skrjabini miyazakii]|uniref:DUF4806 domain-containing protein n=1 Tax=Paragonimus skrjabini miyazakii TaxID=59628 RepID=A0A8S9YNQ7_9TREM|nr:hypothetical protein EG68_08469 [Paragonimus skrjabini miyazakii]
MENVVMQNVRIREELHALRLEVNALRFQHAAAGPSTTQLFPVRLLMQTVEDMQLLKVKLEDAALYKKLLIFLTSVGGTSIGECTRNVMKTLKTDDVAKNINWRGANNRMSIACTPLATAIVESVMKKGYHGVSHADGKMTIQRWIQKAKLSVVREVDYNNADVSAFTS